VVVALLVPFGAAAGELVPWRRQAPVRVPDGRCLALELDAVGRGVLELRLHAPGAVPLRGVDAKRSGASVLLSGEDPSRPTLALYSAGGIHARTARVSGPLRIGLEDGRVCLGDGPAASACGRPVGRIAQVLQVPFGAGWSTRLVPCAYAAAQPARTGAWITAWWLRVGLAALGLAMLLVTLWRAPGWRVRVAAGGLALAGGGALSFHASPLAMSAGLAPGLLLLLAVGIGAGSLLLPGRSARGRPGLALLAVVVAGTLLAAPHPVRVAAPAAPAVPELWRDTAHWHPRALHQTLAFRERPMAGLPPAAERWLVLGGSVAYGEGVAPDRTFSAVAEARLRGEGRAVQVLNAGAQGWNAANADALLAGVGDALGIDGIVLVSVLNNATLPVVGPFPAACEGGALAAWACNQLRSIHFLQWPKALLPKPGNAERHAARLGRILARERARGRRVLLVDEPTAAEQVGRTDWFLPFGVARDTVRRVAATYGLELHPVAPALAPLPSEVAFLDGIHPSPAGHQRIGAAVHALLRSPVAASPPVGAGPPR